MNGRRFVLDNCFIQSAIKEKMQIENPVLAFRYSVVELHTRYFIAYGSLYFLPNISTKK